MSDVDIMDDTFATFHLYLRYGRKSGTTVARRPSAIIATTFHYKSMAVVDLFENVIYP